jgi:hypothetical protein
MGCELTGMDEAAQFDCGPIDLRLSTTTLTALLNMHCFWSKNWAEAA